MPGKEQVFVVGGGQIRTLYTDQFKLRDIGTLTDVRRASHVEAVPDKPGFFYVDLQPVGGPTFFDDEDGKPFESREAALAFEVRWLNANFLGVTPATKDGHHAQEEDQQETSQEGQTEEANVATT